MHRWNHLSLLIIYSRKKQKATLLLVWSRQLKVLILQNIASQRNHCYCWGKSTHCFVNLPLPVHPFLLSVWSYENQVTLIKVILGWEMIMERAVLGFVCWGPWGIAICWMTLLIFNNICIAPFNNRGREQQHGFYFSGSAKEIICSV